VLLSTGPRNLAIRPMVCAAAFRYLEDCCKD